MATVEIRNLRKNYGVLEVIHGVSIDIEDGEFVALVGPSGCGKSTLLRMIAGLEHVTKGEIAIGSRVVNDIEPKNRDIAMVFQNYALYPHMTVAKNMAFSLWLNGVSRGEIQKRVERASQILGLESLLERYPRQLSGGQRQRVAMGRAIVRDPMVFLFDEPLSNLDAKLRVQMRAEIKELHQRLKTTTVYVTHDQVEAMTLADRIVVMQGGVIEQIGSPIELYDHPNSLFVAGFIGSPPMNFLKGTVQGGDLPSLMTNEGLALRLPDHVKGLAPGREVVFGFRPQNLTLDPAGMPCEVIIVEPTGSETQLNARVGSSSISVLFHDRVQIRPGETVNLLPDLARAHVFDGKTGRRIE
ncbi:multiple sugar transport system ATP-binding protein [Rhizobium sp. BK313]|uniref:ABC transporter ATP-binding protein n=1 Tax=Rhizobium sp. BK313 TaxID=2587081 RepID=UPI00105E9500|nr:sn-glycerol-3-phosphate ABC transporter ATP-binding protein UgpC [Rhizobium sp. BK313]MBB3457967.1 multiple sugar transport system ATP-binding protein [Rhizobium sp. BK313]